MSQGATGVPSLVRVTVASATRRVDLVLPGAVPVAELLPELARSVGLLDGATVYAGYRLTTADGRELAVEEVDGDRSVHGAPPWVASTVAPSPARGLDPPQARANGQAAKALRRWCPAGGSSRRR